VRVARWVHLARGDAGGRSRPGGREALLRYVLRPPVAQERVEQRGDGLVRITLNKAYADGTIAVDMDPPVAAVPAGHQRAPTAPAHHPLRECAGPGEPLEVEPGARGQGLRRIIASTL
jgi:hypothetical protein